MTYLSEVLADSPLMVLPLTTDATDSSGNARHGTNNGATFGVASGPVPGENAARFDGTNDYIEVPATGLDTDTTGITVEAWMKSTGVTSTIVCRWNGPGGTANQRWVLGLSTFDSGLPTFTLRDTGYRTVTAPASPAPDYSDGAWHHVAVVINGTGAGSMEMFVDKVSVATSSRSSTNLSGDTQVLRVGAKNEGAEFFNGDIAYVAVYGTALTSTRIAAHFDAVPTGLTVANATQAQTAENVALAQTHVLAVASATQAQSAENVALSFPSVGYTLTGDLGDLLGPVTVSDLRATLVPHVNPKGVQGPAVRLGMVDIPLEDDLSFTLLDVPAGFYNLQLTYWDASRSERASYQSPDFEFTADSDYADIAY